MPNAAIQDIYELSPLQQGMLFHTLYAPGTGVYLEQVVYRLPVALDPTAFEEAWRHLAASHSILRTSFVWDDLAKPLQVVHREVRIPIEHQHWGPLSETERKVRIERLLADDAQRGFEIAQPPLLRVTSVADGGATDVLLTFHHALLDGWSLQLLMQDLAAAYEAAGRKQPPALPPRRPYTDHIGWLQAQDMEAAERFWRERLAGFRRPTPLNVDTLAPAGTGPTAHGQVERWLSAQATRTLEDYARRRQITLNTLVQGAWALLLSRYSGETDVMFGTVVSGRPATLAGAEQMIGLFINTLPTRLTVEPRQTPEAWLRDLQQSTSEARQFDFTPLAEIHSWSEAPRDRLLFDSVIVFENYPMAQSRSGQAQGSAHHVERTNLPLTVLVVPGERLHVRVLFDTRRFEDPTIERLLGHFETLLTGLADDPPSLQAVPMTTPAETQQLIHDWNAAAAAPEPGWSIVHAFRQAAAERETSTALVYGERVVTFGDLTGEVDRLSRALSGRGAQPGAPVAVCLGRSVEGVAALLALLALGAVYVPLDPDHPRRVLRDMAGAAGCHWVITRRPLAARFEGLGVQVLCIEDLPSAPSADDEPAGVRDYAAEPGDPMYIVFTSGSTGAPKPIAVDHRQVLNRLEWMWREYPFEPGEVACNKTSPSFVDHLWEVLGGLLQGTTTLVVPDETARDPQALVDALASAGVTRLWLVPSLLRTLLQFDGLAQKLPKLLFWVSSGEALSPELFEHFVEVMDGATLYNLYGTSEVWDATWWDPSRDLRRYCGQIGKPTQNVRIYVLDAHGQPAPIGVPGELCVAGAGVARGYLNGSSNRFVIDPFAGGRMYRTGDICRFLPDGALQFLGRRDHEVKILGQRIDLAHVESVLSACPGVLHAAVVPVRTGTAEGRLLAYVSAIQGGEISTSRLRAYARERLVSAMRPAGYFLLDGLPLTVSGKIDRARLPEPRLDALDGDSEGRPPHPGAETRLAELFREVLGALKIGASDDFFTDLGGNSLLATQLVARIRKTFSIDLPLRAFFEAPTVEQAARVLEGLQPPAAPEGPIVRRPRVQPPGTGLSP